MIDLVEKISELSAQQTPYVLVTLVGIKGSAPQIEGAKMLITANGLYWGTIGGGKIEAHSIRYAQAMIDLRESKPHAMTWNLQIDIGMSCGGEVTVFFDVQKLQNWTLAIFGAGHIAQELCRVLQTWSCQVLVFDTRAEWLNRLPQARNIKALLCSNLSAQVVSLPQRSYLLAMTMGHATDLPVLREAFRQQQNFSFIGVIGSDVKAKKIKKELREEGLPAAVVENLVSPLGLPIGNSTPPEIAISICSQLLALRDGLTVQVHHSQ